MSGAKYIQDNIGNQEELLSSLQLNINWIKKSFKSNKGQGSSMYATSWGSWSEDYPETTGYLLPTLIRSSGILKDKKLKALAINQIAYFKSLQLNSGAFKVSESKAYGNVFDSSQIMLGLIEIHSVINNDDVQQMIIRCYNWLISVINNEGIFIKANYKKNYNPSYYSRILWPLLLAEKLITNKSSKSQLLYKYLKSLLNKNGTFNKCSFDGSPFAFTHNLIYSYRGLLESAKILNDIEFIKKLEVHLSNICDKIIKSNAFYGEYDSQWNGNSSFICSTGNAQLIVVLISIYKKTKNIKVLKVCSILMKPLLKSQRNYLFNKGAVPSSIPVWGKYQRYRYTNWTQKFYADALLDLILISK